MIWGGVWMLVLCGGVARGSSSLDGVPTVDLLDPQAHVTMYDALSRFGFFYATNHGVPESLVEAQFEQSALLFSLPLATKRSMEFVQQLDIGYLDDQALDEESGVKDTKEGFVMTNNRVATRPDAGVDQSDPLAGAVLKLPPLPNYESVMREWARELYRLNSQLNRIMFRALDREQSLAEIASQPFFVVKQLKYGPPSEKADDDINNGAGAHADWGALTLLFTDGTPGLEIHYNESWLPVPPRRGAVIVNAGDQIEFWTSGLFRSANHRVRALKERFSTAFFAYFDYHAPIHPLNLGQHEDGNASCAPPSLQQNPHYGKTTGDYFAFKLCESVGLQADSCHVSTLTDT